MQIKRLARAKINLCLHVVGQQPDGYHRLDSIVAFADIGDEIIITPDAQFSLDITGPFAEKLLTTSDNLILRAAHLFHGDCTGAAITLFKNLPVAAGIGSGSANAAATLHLFSEMTKTSLTEDMAVSLGADVPVCVFGKTCRMQGIGERITPLPHFPKLFAVLVCPDITVPTRDIFKALENKNNAPLPDPNPLQNAIEFLCHQRNDLQDTAVAIVPQIEECLDALESQGAFFARMSGSGATCFGIFTNCKAAERAACDLKSKYPYWWVKPCTIGD